MPANIAEGANGVHRAAYANTPGWHRLGTTEETAEGEVGFKWNDIYEKAQLDYPLELGAALARAADGTITEDPKRRSIIRTDLDPQAVFGFVSDGYSLIPNLQVGEVLDELVEAKEAAYVAAGALGRGERVWAVLDLRAVHGLQIKGDPSKYGAFLFATTRHDGTGALQIGRAMLRLECQNMLDMALRTGETTGKLVSIRHSGDPATKLAAARDILGFVNRFVEEFKVVGNALADTPLPAGFVKAFLEDLIPIDEDAERTKSKEDAREAIAHLYAQSPTLVGVPGTAYRLVQAVAEYGDHFRPVRGKDDAARAENRFKSVLEGPAHDLKQDALDRIVEKLEIRLPKEAVAA